MKPYVPPSFPPPDLAALPAQCWAALEAGAATRDHAFHTAVVATVRDAAPEARTVVLRAADAPSRTLWFHTDTRSAKVAALAANPRLAWVFWDAGAALQLRASGRVARPATADEIATHWATLPDTSRSLYAGIETFLPVRCTVEALDWLRLDRGGHQRAQLDWREGRWRGRWVAP